MHSLRGQTTGEKAMQGLGFILSFLAAIVLVIVDVYALLAWFDGKLMPNLIMFIGLNLALLGFIQLAFEGFELSSIKPFLLMAAGIGMTVAHFMHKSGAL